ncbi:MAG: hypothetical protein RIS19_368 [Actinomycetota bacterium]
MQTVLAGLATGLSLIVAIGAQNAFILRQGLLKKHVLPIVLICAFLDATLIILGVLGLGSLISLVPGAIEVIRWVGVAFLVWYGSTALRRFMKNESLKAAEAGSGTSQANNSHCSSSNSSEPSCLYRHCHLYWWYCQPVPGGQMAVCYWSSNSKLHLVLFSWLRCFKGIGACE